ncbi:amidase [Azospirillum sp. B4]|uniref:amidase n=1 Tax=Azospirillum sp. B4 TaxID=95605 RepID=UPI00034CC0F6|nr:amidase [Azospirillum sp. B4]
MMERHPLSDTGQVEATISRITRLDPQLQAFVHVDPDIIRRQAAAIALDGGLKPLAGLTFGIKDIIDTAAYPTECGSPFHAGRRPSSDAACVAQLCAAGALPMGKTVTTEFAFFSPGPTRNPYDPRRTPGGSSSGSAVAVATGMVDFALGSQTAASITRPASYCGVVGFKPSFGSYSLAGVKGLAPEFDTLGALARDVATIARVHAVLGGPTPQEPDLRPLAPRAIGYCPTPWWPTADQGMRQAMEETRERLGLACPIVTVDLDDFAHLADLHAAIMAFETAQALATEWREGRDQLSPQIQGLIATGQRIPLADHRGRLAQAEAARVKATALFDQVDLLIAPAAPGAAPLGLTATGDPLFSRMWTLLRLPSITLQIGMDADRMPLGAQLLGPFRGDEALLRRALWVEQHLPARTAPDLTGMIGSDKS